MAGTKVEVKTHNNRQRYMGDRSLDYLSTREVGHPGSDTAWQRTVWIYLSTSECAFSCYEERTMHICDESAGAIVATMGHALHSGMYPLVMPTKTSHLYLLNL